MQQTSEVAPQTARKTTLLDPNRLPKTLCLMVLAFIPINMFASPVVDFFTIQQRPTNWTVTLSAVVFLLTALPLLAVALFSLKSRPEKRFLAGTVVFFIYAFATTIYLANDLFYPLFGLVSLLGAALAGTTFYVVVRENIIGPKVVFNTLAIASVFTIIPLLLVHMDIGRFAYLSQDVGASTILYGYENPRAVGWVSTICLTLVAAYLSTQPKDHKIHPMFLIFAFIAATSLFWSGSRGGVVAFTVGFIFVFALSPTKNTKGVWAILSCIAAGAAVSYFLHLPNQAYGMFARISQNLEQDTIAGLSSGRTHDWTAAISYIREQPLIGYGYLPHKSLDGFGHGSAHNLILDAWLCFGLIIGTITILVGLLFWIRAFAFFRAANDKYVSALFCVITTLLIYCMVSGPYARTFPLLLFAVSSGVLFGLRSQKGNPRA